MIIEYQDKYKEDAKDLLVELQEYLVKIDDWSTQVLKDEYRDGYLEYVLEEVKLYKGKIYLEIMDNKAIGLIVGIIPNLDIVDKLSNDCFKRGRIEELIVKEEYRSFGVGKRLMEAMEKYLFDNGCKRIGVEVFGPNQEALSFYKRKGYTVREYLVSKRT